MIMSAHMISWFMNLEGVRSIATSETLYADALLAWPPQGDGYAQSPAYLIPAAEARELSDDDVAGATLVVFCEEWPPRPGCAAARRTIAACQFGGAAPELLDLVSRQVARLSYHLERVSRVVTSRAPLSHALETVSSYLDVPLALLSTDGELRATAGTLPRGGVGEGLVDRVAAHFSTSNLPLPVSADGEHILSCAVFLGKETYGYLLLFGGTMRLTSAQRDLATTFCTLIATSMALDERSGQRVDSGAERLLAAALEGAPDASRELERHAGSLGWDLGPRFQVVALMTAASLPDRSYLQRLAHQLSELCDGALCAPTRQGVGCLFSGGGDSVIGEAEERRIEEFVRRNNVGAGISEPFEGLGGAARGFVHALSAVTRGRARRGGEVTGVFRFSDYTFPYLREVLSSQEDLLTFCHPGVSRLLEHDRTHASQLVPTVVAYLESDKSPSRVARELSIHRSTLDYRIRRAEEIMGVDLTSADDHFGVWLSLRLLS